MKVLIVEDDNLQRNVLQILLQKAGQETVSVVDGQEAWEWLQKERIHLVITDWMMPRMNGLQLIRNIRSANFPDYTYILLLTSKDLKANIVEGLEAGADDYLTKPFDKNELVARMGIGIRIQTLQMQLAYMARHDTLTDLLNRRALYDVAQENLRRLASPRGAISFLLADIDYFKVINDTYGHLAGDQALRHFGEILKKATPAGAFPGRWGGEEFLIVLPDVEKQQATEIAEKIRLAVAEYPFSLPDGRSVSMTCSLGISGLSPGEESKEMETLVGLADRALYCAKSTGRNRVCK